jgi:uncharacterized protein involved in response to NO
MPVRTRVVPRYPVQRDTLFLRDGYRPFFLGAGLVATISMALWIGFFSGLDALPSGLPPALWHTHEMLFGYSGAVVAGYLLTAVPDWTGRNRTRGSTLLYLLLLWGAGRIAMTMTWQAAPITSSLIDVLFLPAVGHIITRDIIAGGNWRHLPVSAGLALLALANISFHLELLMDTSAAGTGMRMGLAVIVCLVTIVGGRMIPELTNDWFKQTGRQARAQIFSPFDFGVIVLTVIALGHWVAAPEDRTSGLLLANAGIGNALRLIRWRGVQACSEPIVWVMHIGYLWVPVGLLLLGLAVLWTGVPHDAGFHALSVGVIGTMAIALMTQVSLGHSGYALRADGPTFCIYAMMVFAATARVTAAFPIEHQNELIYLAGIYWCAAFAVFCMRYGALILNE